MTASAIVAVMGACRQPGPTAVPGADSVTGTLTVDRVAAQLGACRPGHDVHVFVEVDTTLGRLRFGEGKLAWNGEQLACAKLDRRWGGGIRQDGSAYFRGTLDFRCGAVVGDLVLDCGRITAEEAAQLAANRAAAVQRAASPDPAGLVEPRRAAPPDPAGLVEPPRAASPDPAGSVEPPRDSAGVVAP